MRGLSENRCFLAEKAGPHVESGTCQASKCIRAVMCWFAHIDFFMDFINVNVSII